MQSYQFITNINDLYKPPLNAGQQRFYQQFLQGYTDNQLDELWEVAMESHLHASPPSIGKLKEYAKSITAVKIVSQEDIEDQERRNLTDEDIFSTRLGRLSLKQGWADSYRIICRRRGIPEQTDSEILIFQKAQHEADKSIADLKVREDVFSTALVKFRESMKSKNESLKNQYTHLWKPEPLVLERV